MIKVVFIIDNKLRDLWGMYDVVKKAKEQKILIHLCNKFNWKLAIDYLNPHIVISPNAKDKGGKSFRIIIDYAIKKKNNTNSLSIRRIRLFKRIFKK